MLYFWYRKGVLHMSEHAIVDRITDYIEKHLEQDLSLDRIAMDLNYSKFYIVRIFAEKTGKTIEQIYADTERDNYMSAKEALEYGLIDRIIDKR